MNEPYERSTTPYFCSFCRVRSPWPLLNTAGEYVCQYCLHPLVAKKKKSSKKRSPRNIARRARQWRASLISLGERDGWVCWLCGEKVDPHGPWPHRPSADHVVRRRDGGRGRDNLRLAHQSCNEYREGANVRPFAPPLVVEEGSSV